MSVKMETQPKKEWAFRIVKDRWYHRMLDKFYFDPWNKNAVSYQEIHLSTKIMKKKNKWYLVKPQQRIVAPKPVPDFHKEWATKMGDPNYVIDENSDNGIHPTGFEIDPTKNETMKEIYDKKSSESNIPTKINSLDEIPADVLLNMFEDPQMLKLIDPSWEVLENLTDRLKDRIRNLKEQELQNQDIKPEETKKEDIKSN